MTPSNPEAARPPLGLKQFRHENCYSYIVHDPASRDAAVIDPRVELMDGYRDWIASNGLRVRWAIDTHLQLEHLSATHLIRDAYGAVVAMSDRTESARATRRLNDGDRLELGALALETIPTPGHTPDGITLALRADDGRAWAFTGNALLVGSAGRTDLPGADAAELWRSFRTLATRLPGDTVAFPGHDTADVLFTTLDTERRRNPVFRADTAEAYAAKRHEQNPTHSRFPEEIARRREFNRVATPAGAESTAGPGLITCGPALAEELTVARINVDKYGQKLREVRPGQLFLDVREPDEFRAGHIPGTRNLPVSDVALSLSELKTADRVYVSCLSGRRSEWVANTLTYVNLPDVVIVSGGFQAWMQSGRAVEKNKA